MAPASRDEPDVPAEDARDDCRTNQPSPPGSGEGSVEEDTRARDAETTPDQATDAKPDEDDEERQVRGSARASRHDPFPEASRARLLLSFRDFQCRFFPGAVRFVEGARARSVSATRVGECCAPRVHGRARADPERPPRAFPAFRADVRPLDAGSSEDAERLRPELFRLDSREPVGDWSERDRGEIFSPRFFLFHRVPFRSVPSGFSRPPFFSRHAERAKRPKNLTSRRRSLVLLLSRRRRNRACAWTARLSRAFPATRAGAAKCAIASRRIDETCARA
jgi:hypothetical protein